MQFKSACTPPYLFQFQIIQVEVNVIIGSPIGILLVYNDTSVIKSNTILNYWNFKDMVAILTKS